ncbi:MAG: proton-conducting transporter membrane subunit, partial [Candidatus Neomarinimicrobiota bacterium]
MPNLQSIAYFSPELILLATVLGIILITTYLNIWQKVGTPLIGLSLGIALIKLVVLRPDTTHGIFYNLLVWDPFGRFLKICLVLMAIGLFSIITRDRRTKPIITAEFGFLFCCMIFAALVTVSANHLIVLFIALQIINLTDILISQRNNSNPEIITSGWHDLIFQVFSGMVMLMGIVLIYGITGSLYIANIGRMLAVQPGLKFPVTMAWVMILFGFTHSITGVLRLHRDLRSGPVTSEPVRLISLTIPQFAEIGVLIRLIEVGFGKIADQRPLFLTLSLFAVIAIVYPGWLAI